MLCERRWNQNNPQKNDDRLKSSLWKGMSLVAQAPLILVAIPFLFQKHFLKQCSIIKMAHTVTATATSDFTEISSKAAAHFNSNNCTNTLSDDNDGFRVAHTTSIAQCQNWTAEWRPMNINASIVDGPAVMAHSMRRMATKCPKCDLVAIIHPCATHCTQNLQKMCDLAIVRDLGFNISKMNAKHEHHCNVNSNGCCGLY